MTWNTFEGGLAPRKHSGGFAWREAGRGQPVLLLHSLGLNADAWEPQLTGLAGRRRVIAIDLPGHGQTESLPDYVGLAEYVEVVAWLVDALGLAPVPVVGHSFGAMIALGLALDRPDKVSALVTLNAVYCRDSIARADVETHAKRLSGASVDVIETIAHWFPDDPNGPMARRVSNWLRATNPKDYAIAYRVFATADHVHEGRLGELACPALFMTGVADPHSTPAMSERMAHEAPKGRALALPRARHMMNLTHPSETNNAIAGFLAAAPPRR